MINNKTDIKSIIITLAIIFFLGNVNIYSQYSDIPINNKKATAPEVEKTITLFSAGNTNELQKYLMQHKITHTDNKIEIVVELTPSQKSKFLKFCRDKEIRVASSLGWDVIIYPTFEQLTSLRKTDTIVYKYMRLPYKGVLHEIENGYEHEGVRQSYASQYINSIEDLGSNLKVGVIDFQFDHYNEYEELNHVPDLNISHRKTFPWGNSFFSGDGNHGSNCMETLYPFVPDAEFFGVRCNGPEYLDEAINWLTEKEVDIISLSAGSFSLPLNYEHDIFTEIDDFTENGGVIIVAAGNSAEKHWMGSFTDNNNDDYLEFSNEDDKLNFNESFPSGKSISITLNWSETINGHDNTDEQYQIQLFDASNSLLKETEIVENGDRKVALNYTFDNLTNPYIKVRHTSGSAESPLHLFAYETPAIEYSTPEKSISPIASYEKSIAIGAVNHISRNLTSYSSHGPAFFTENTKPDYVSHADLNLMVYNEGNDSFNEYTKKGTSFAAPNFAGILGIVWAMNPEMNRSQIINELDEMSQDYGFNGSDSQFGRGFIQLPALDDRMDGFEEFDNPNGFNLNNYFYCVYGSIERTIHNINDRDTISFPFLSSAPLVLRIDNNNSSNFFIKVEETSTNIEYSDYGKLQCYPTNSNLRIETSVNESSSLDNQEYSLDFSIPAVTTNYSQDDVISGEHEILAQIHTLNSPDHPNYYEAESVEFEYSTNKEDWYDVPNQAGSNIDDNLEDGINVNFDTEMAGIQFDESVWIRCRTMDEYGQTTLWWDSKQITVNNQPSLSISSSSNSTPINQSIGLTITGANNTEVNLTSSNEGFFSSSTINLGGDGEATVGYTPTVPGEHQLTASSNLESATASITAFDPNSGHDVAITYLNVGSFTSPGSDVDVEQVKIDNEGTEVENDIPVKFELYNPDGTMCDSHEEIIDELNPGDNAYINDVLLNTSEQEGNYELKVEVELLQDNDYSNNIESSQIYVGENIDTDEYTMEEHEINNADSPYTFYDQTFDFIGGNSDENQMWLNINGNGQEIYDFFYLEGLSGDNVAFYPESVAHFPGFEDDFWGTLFVGENTQSLNGGQGNVSLSPSNIIVNPGEYQELNFTLNNNNDEFDIDEADYNDYPDIAILLGGEGANTSDTETVYEWFDFENQDDNIAVYSLSIPNNAQLGTYSVWIGSEYHQNGNTSETRFVYKLVDITVESDYHDVASTITNPSNNDVIDIGNEINIQGQISNQGDYTETVSYTFNISGPNSYTTSYIGSEVVSSGNESSASNIWNTDGLPEGDYTITMNSSIDSDDEPGNNEDQVAIQLIQNNPTISEVSATNLSCYESVDGQIIIEASGGTGILQYSIDEGFGWQENSTFENLEAGSYYVWVKDENENITVWENNPVNISQPPSAPSSLIASTVTSEEIELVWEDVDNESGYKVFRSLESQENYTQVADLSSNTVNYFDDELPPESTFCYKVQSYNSTGACEFSPVACAMTDEPPAPEIEVTLSSLTINEPDQGSVEIANNGDALLEVTNISSDQSWLSTTASLPLEISSGNSQTVPIQIDWAQIESETSATLSIESNDPDEASVDVEVNVSPMPESHFVPIWQGNAYHPMNFVVSGVNIDGFQLETGDEIAVFDGGDCVGVGILNNTLDPSNHDDNIAIIASKDDGTGNGYTEGNPVSYKLWDSSEETESIVTNVTFPYEPDYMFQNFTELETTVVLLESQTTVDHQTTYQQGWNMISFAVEPEENSLQSILQPLIDNNHLTKVIDEQGNIIEEMPWGWVNNIGPMSPTEGYYIKVSADDNITTNGALVALPYDIPLASGWNMIGYPSMTQQDATEAFSNLMDNGILVKVIDEAGNIIEEMPWAWVNNIGSLQAGEGYYIKVTEDATLTIEEPATRNGQLPESYQAPVANHFTPVYQGNPYEPMQMVVDASTLNLQQGDELAIFSNGQCVGAAGYNPDKGHQYITTSKDDSQTAEQDGYLEGTSVILKVYRKADNTAYHVPYEPIEGPSGYEPLQTKIVRATTLTTGIDGEQAQSVILYQNKPNPFTNKTEISYYLPEAGKVHISVCDLHGQRQTTVANQTQQSGYHKKSFDASQLSPGVYIYKLSYQNQRTQQTEILLKKMTVLR